MSTAHPTELLAAFVDGTIADGDRALLTGHLQTCEQCRNEIVLARSARDALAALPEAPAPSGLSQAVARQTKAPSHWNQKASRVVWAAAAAAIVAIAAWFGVRAATNVSNPTNAPAARDQAVASAPTPDSEPGPFDTDGNYDAGEVAALTIQAARQGNKGEVLQQTTSGSGEKAVAASPAPAAVPAPSPSSTSGSVKFANQHRTVNSAGLSSGKSSKCFDTVGAFNLGGQLQRVIQAKYEGTPAYLGVFFEPPPEGGSLDRAVTWVVSKKSCDVLGFSQHLFNPPSPVDSPFPHQPAQP
jgi:hypothetical protein